jgi:hypothetical protein
MVAEGVPLQSGMLAAYGCEGCGGETALLVVRMRVRLFYPSQSAGVTDLVVDGE